MLAETMAVVPEDVRNIMRHFELQYRDTPDDGDDGNWYCGLFLPTENYNFDDRGGFSTDIVLGNKKDGKYHYVRMLVPYLYGTEDLSLKNQLLAKINSLNNKCKLIKWTLTTGKGQNGITDIRLHIEADFLVEGDTKLSAYHFFDIHGFIYRQVESEWEGFEEILGLRKPVEVPDIQGSDPQNLDKTQLLEMFDKYLDEKFDNS